MNILILSWRDPKHPQAGGAEQVIHEHAKGWIKAGHQVTLFSSRFAGSLKQETIDGVKIIRSGYQYLGVQLNAFFYYQKDKENIDLVIDQFHGFPFFTPLYIKKPIIAVIQETAREVWFLNPLPWPVNLIVGMLGYILEPFIFLLYRSMPFVTGSNSAKEDVSRFGIPRENIEVWPHGVVVNIPSIPPKPNQKIITFLGVLSKDKGVEDAIDCFAILSKDNGFEFWIIGKPETKEYYNKLLKKVENLNLTGKVRFYGYVSDEKKFNLLAQTSVLINPSVREGWGLVNIEANRVKTPVVAYNCPGLVDSVKDGFSGVICKENTPEKLANEVKKLLQNQVIYKQFQVNALKWSKNFNWIKSIKISLESLKKVSKRNSFSQS